MNFIAIVQARLTSRRLPQKVMMPLDEKQKKPAILEHLVDRIHKINMLQTIIAVPQEEHYFFSGLPFLRSCNVVSGAIYDVHERITKASRKFQSNDYLIRITADNPFIDHKILAQNIEYVRDSKPEYSYPEWLPLGMGYEIIKISTLRSLARYPLTPAQKEHVTIYIKQNRHLFDIRPFYLDKTEYPFPLPVRLTVDEGQDLEMARMTFKHFLGQGKIFFTAKDVIRLQQDQALFFQNNLGIRQKSPLSWETSYISNENKKCMLPG